MPRPVLASVATGLRSVSRSVTRPCVVTSLTSAAESDSPIGSPSAIGRDDLKRERFAVEVDVAGGAQADLEPADRQHDAWHRPPRCPGAAGRPARAPCSSAKPSVANSK